MAIENGDHKAMFNLGLHYSEIEDSQSRENMIKYYMMAIDLGNSDAMVNLGAYYSEIKGNI